jgi:hypothetical protein
MKILGFVPQPNLLRSDTSPHEDFGFCATRTPGERASTQPTNLMKFKFRVIATHCDVVAVGGLEIAAGAGHKWI